MGRGTPARIAGWTACLHRAWLQSCIPLSTVSQRKVHTRRFCNGERNVICNNPRVFIAPLGKAWICNCEYLTGKGLDKRVDLCIHEVNTLNRVSHCVGVPPYLFEFRFQRIDIGLAVNKKSLMCRHLCKIHRLASTGAKSETNTQSSLRATACQEEMYMSCASKELHSQSSKQITKNYLVASSS